MNDATLDATAAKLDPALVDRNFPIFLTRLGPAVWPTTREDIGPPAIVVSVPKSGTYFAEALYKRMGYEAVRIHAMDTFCNDLRCEELSGIKAVPMTALAPLILPGQIVVSHCSRTAAIEAALRRYKKIYLYRDLREVLVSHARAEALASGEDPLMTEAMPSLVEQHCRERGEALKTVIIGASTWRNDPDVLAIDFAELTAADIDRQDALAARFQDFMGWPKAPVIAALRAVPEDDTPTRTWAAHSTVEGNWTAASEAWFQAHMAELEVRPDDRRRGDRAR